MATPSKRVTLDFNAGNVRLVMNQGLNNGVSFGFSVWDPAAGKYVTDVRSGSLHPLDPSPTLEFDLGPPGRLQDKRLVIAFRLTINNPNPGNLYRTEADIVQDGEVVDTLDYETQDPAENGVYNELNAFFI